VYHRKFASRARASSTVSYNALRKLVINPASALYNATQFHVYAAPFARGANEFERFVNANTAWKDGINLWYNNTFVVARQSTSRGSGRSFIEIGPDLMPSKQLAGGSGSSWGDVAGTFPQRAGKNLWDYSTDVGKWDGHARVQRW